MSEWDRDKTAREVRLVAGGRVASGKVVHRRDAIRLLDALLKPGDRVCLEGDIRNRPTCWPRR